MGATTNIAWTDATVNFWWGCTKVSPACDHCYAEATARRAGGDHWGLGVPRRKIKGARALIHQLDNAYSEWAADSICRRENAKAFGLPVPKEGRRRRVFIQSMSDLFDLEVPLEWFDDAWGLIVDCDRLAIQICTKRVSAVEKRLAQIGYRGWPQHVGLLITVVSQREADRDVPRLLALKEKLGIPWVGLSIEPLLGPIDLTSIEPDGDHVMNALQPKTWEAEIADWRGTEPDWETSFLDWYDLSETPAGNMHAGLDWVIVGGESGGRARPMDFGWARSLRDQCEAAGVAFFMKQVSGFRPADTSIPADLMIRQFPAALP